MRGEQFLTKSRDYGTVYSQGTSWVSGPIVMKAITNGLEFSRYGFSVSRRVGSAVTRNHIKRRLREILRLMTLKPGWDIVFIARTSAADADYATLKSGIESVLVRANIIEPVTVDGF